MEVLFGLGIHSLPVSNSEAVDALRPRVLAVARPGITYLIAVARPVLNYHPGKCEGTEHLSGISEPRPVFDALRSRVLAVARPGMKAWAKILAAFQQPQQILTITTLHQGLRQSR
jgi:hypothetical protein